MSHVLPVTPNTKQRTETQILPVAAAQASGPGPFRAPLFVPSKQLYFWFHEWQAGEAEALQDVLEGRVRTFSSGASAAAWLLSDEE
jgi:hypothetical protein